MTERCLIESIKYDIASIKSKLIALQKLNKDAGRTDAVRFIMGRRGELMVWHEKCGDGLDAMYPEFSKEVQDNEITVFGGGGR